ncbi:hypothetical protein AAY473_038178 [Plecturocebus cupreus]
MDGNNQYQPFQKHTKSENAEAAAGDLQASRVWNGPPAVLQQRGLTVRSKTNIQKEITSSSTKRTSTPRPYLKVINYKDHR